MRSPTLVLTFAFALAAGCDVGQVTIPAPGPGAGPDAGAGPDGAPASGPDAGATGPTCKDGVLTADTGHHNPGLDCMSAGCHGPGGDGPLWTVAGTLYGSAAGGTPVTGATITIHDAGGATIDLVSAQNGNFYTGQTIALPATVYASKCPAVMPMIASASVGSCNSCHVGGSATGAVHLP